MLIHTPPTHQLTLVVSQTESGELCSAADLAYRTECERNKSRVVWPVHQRINLAPAAAASLRSRIPRSRIIPVEIRRHVVAGSGKGAKSRAGKDEEESSVSGA